MIDYEVDIFDTVYPHVAPLCAEGKFVSTQILDKTAFPAAALFELSNTTVRSRQSSTPKENFASIAYQLDVFAESKAECRSVFNAADEAMLALNFTRISQNYLDNAGNPRIHRMTARYEAEVDEDGNLYRG